MISLTLETISYPDCTIGRLFYDKNSASCFSLELPWLGNMHSISCIPSGVYWFKRRVSPTNGEVIQLSNVPDRTYIQIHAGNFTRQVQGCILVGDAIKYLDSDTIPDVTNSRKTLEKVMAKTPDEGYIKVVRHNAD